MGAWISLPGSPAAMAMGTRARPVARAVISTGTSRSMLPRRTASAREAPSRSIRWR